MKRLASLRMPLLIISAVLFIGSLGGIAAARTLPDEVKQETSLLDWEHQGRFNYVIYQKPSYLFNDIPLEPAPPPAPAPTVPNSPPTTPKFPTAFISHADITFAYEFAPDQQDKVTTWEEQVEVKAAFKQPKGDAVEMKVVPLSAQAGNFAVAFSLNSENISSGATITVTATVYTTINRVNSAPVFESFTQSFTIQPAGTLLEIDKNLTSTQRASFGELSYEQRGKFGYTLYPRAGTPWQGTTFGPPEPPPPPPPPPPPEPETLSAKILRPGDTVFPKLIDRIDMTYNYELKSPSPLRQVSTEVEISAVIEAPKLWSKKFPLFQAKEDGAFSANFSLDLAGYQKSLDAIRTETGASADSYNFSIVAEVRAVARTDAGPINEAYSQTLSTTLGGSSLEWSELTQSKPGSVKTTRVVPNAARYLGLSVSGARTTSVVFAAVFLALFASSVVLYLKVKPIRLSETDKMALEIGKKYRERITESVSQTPSSGEKVISLLSIEDLLKVADELGKPIIHQSYKASGERHDYYILDAGTRYQYALGADVLSS